MIEYDYIDDEYEVYDYFLDFSEIFFKVIKNDYNLPHM